MNPPAFNLKKCDELRAFGSCLFGSTTYNRHTGVPRLPDPDRAFTEITSLTEPEFHCPMA